LFRFVKFPPPSGRSVPLHTALFRAKNDYTVTRYSAWHVRDHPAVRISAGKSGALRRSAYLAHASAVRSWDEGIPRADTARHLTATKRICFAGDARTKACDWNSNEAGGWTSHDRWLSATAHFQKLQKISTITNSSLDCSRQKY